MNLANNSGMEIKKTYIYGNSQILAQHNGAPATNNKFFYLHDRLGSVRLVINSAGDVNNTYTYSAFGEMFPTETTESISNPFKFSGQFYDVETNEYYLRNRQYEPILMRFTSIDPADGKFENPLSLHKYLYCFNNPINLIDPAGLDAYLFLDPYGGPEFKYGNTTIYDGSDLGHVSVGVDDVRLNHSGEVITRSAAFGKLVPEDKETTGTSLESAISQNTKDYNIYVTFKNKPSSKYSGSTSDYLIGLYLTLGYKPSGYPYCSTYSKAALAYGEYDMGDWAGITPTKLMSAAIERAIFKGDKNIEVSRNAVLWYFTEAKREEWLNGE